MLDKAIYIASSAHLGQFDKGGHAYILHPLHIMHQLAAAGRDEITQAIGVLHDVMEDNLDWTEDRLRAEGIPEEVIDGLRLMNHSQEDDYFEYIEKMKDNLRVLYVKREDIIHNSTITRLKGMRAKDTARMEKYIKAYVMINKMIAYFEDMAQFKSEHIRK